LSVLTDFYFSTGTAIWRDPGFAILERRLAAAAVDDRHRCHDLRPGGGGHLDRLAGRPARRHHVLDHDNALGVCQAEAPAQPESAILALGENRPGAERPAHLVPDDQPAEGRREDRGRPQVADPVGQRAPESLGMGRMLQDEGALEVARAVEAGREPEMPLEQRGATAEQVEQLVTCHEGAPRKQPGWRACSHPTPTGFGSGRISPDRSSSHETAAWVFLRRC